MTTPLPLGPPEQPGEDVDQAERERVAREAAALTAAIREQVAAALADPKLKAPERKHWLDVIAVVLSVIAVVCGLGAIWSQLKVGSDSSAQTLVHDQYELCRVLDQLRVEHPEISHMLALPRLDTENPGEVWSNYALVRGHVRAFLVDGIEASAFPDAAPSEVEADAAARGKLYLQEHAVALHVFDIYEQTLYQRDLAKLAAPEGGWHGLEIFVPESDRQRLQVLNALVNYYHEHMLRNPRLRYHWDHGGADMMEESTRRTYGERVRAAFPNDYTDWASPLESPEPRRVEPTN